MYAGFNAAGNPTGGMYIVSIVLLNHALLLN